MRTACTSLVALALSLGALPASLASEPETPATPARVSVSLLHDAFAKHCVRCHGEKGKPRGRVNLVELASDDELLSRPGLLEKLITVLDDREMPPEDETALDEDLRTRMLAELRTLRTRAARTLPFLRTPIRRMNRFQYNNAVVDLLELDRDIFALNERLLRRRDDYFRPATRKMPRRVRVSCRPLSKDIDSERAEGFRGVAAFPQDKRAEHGFDNRADHLTLSPLLMESFLELSRTIVESPDFNAKECRSWSWLLAPLESPDFAAELRVRLERLLRRAFRRPADAETVDRFVNFAASRVASGASLEETMRSVIGAVLAMPEFLYLYESKDAVGNANDASPVADPGRQRVDGFELASRLAQFLWSSIPDETLLDLAASGELSDPGTLEAQISRLLDDERSSRFCDNFPAQWLQLERLITAVPDEKMFPHFYQGGYRNSLHMMSEPLLLFETVYIEDRSILELVAPAFTWRSRLLRALYEGHARGPGEVQVQTFERVALDDPREGGVITNAAVMTMTSTPTRTQPITRGAWVNAVIFNDPPEPPPADVPALPELDAEAREQLTIRERLAEHRRRADCAGCHERIDPLGFALENYDPTGVWRDRYENGREVDPGGVLFGRHEFRSAVEFKQLILEEKGRFVRGFLAHLLSYALGRELGPADGPALDAMSARALAGDDGLRTILTRIAMSEPFLHKNVLDAEVSNDRASTGSESPIESGTGSQSPTPARTDESAP